MTEFIGNDDAYQKEIEELAAWFIDQWENHRDELDVTYVDAETWDRMMEERYPDGNES